MVWCHDGIHGLQFENYSPIIFVVCVALFVLYIVQVSLIMRLLLFSDLTHLIDVHILCFVFMFHINNNAISTSKVP